jgi:hypothetical protein
MNNYKKLTTEQLKGASYALRMLATSPSMSKTAQSIIREQHALVQIAHESKTSDATQPSDTQEEG